MAGRARHEAAWTHADATVKGRRRGNSGWWMLLVAAVLIAGTSFFAFDRYMNFQTVTFQLRTCDTPLTERSTWADVEAAGCTPTPVTGHRLWVWIEGDQREAVGSGDTWSFEGLPVNYPATGLQVYTAERERSVVLVDADSRKVRRELDPDASGTRWSSMYGSRGDVHTWVLVSP